MSLGTATTLQSTAELVKRMQIDLAFLDVQLLNETTFEVLPILAEVNCSVVFVTAYEQYALKAFKASAIDYLLKPLITEEILRCYKKILHYWDGTRDSEIKNQQQDIVIKEGQYIYKFSSDDILFLSACGVYTKVHFKQSGILKEVLVSKPISSLEKQWSSPFLLRIHRSYVVNTQKITGIKKTGANLCIQIGDVEFFVAKRRSSGFLNTYNPNKA